MKYRSILVLFVAIGLGAVSVFLAHQWLGQAPQTAAAPAPEIKLNKVVVARVPLYFGNHLAHENLKEVPWPDTAVPPGAFTSIDDLIKDGEDRVVLRTIEANEPVLATKVSGFGGRATLSSVISEGMRAMTIRVNDVHGVAGFVLPGDRVDVLITREEEGSNRPFTDVLLQKVKVLGIDQEASEQKDDPIVARAVTLEVTARQSQKLALGQTVGTLSLNLRDSLNVEAEETRTVTLADLRDGEVTAPPEPPKQVVKTVVRKAAPRRSSAYSVRVVRALQATQQTVKRESASAAPAPRRTSPPPQNTAPAAPSPRPLVPGF